MSIKEYLSVALSRQVAQCRTGSLLDTLKSFSRTVWALEAQEAACSMAEAEAAPQQAAQQLVAPLAGLGVSSELKSALAFALDHLCAVRPEDPVDYLARKLYEYQDIMHPKAVETVRCDIPLLCSLLRGKPLVLLCS